MNSFVAFNSVLTVASSDFSDASSDAILNRLTNSLPLLIAHIIAIFFLSFILWKLVYKPFSKWNLKRLNLLKEKNNEIDDKLKNINKMEALSNKKLIETEEKARIYLNDLKIKLEKDQKIALQKIELKKSNLIKDAKNQIQQMEREFQEDLEKAIVENSIFLLNKLLSEEINSTKHQKLIDDFIKNLND